MAIGIQKDSPAHSPDYESWGLFGRCDVNPVDVTTLRLNALIKTLTSIGISFNDGFKAIYAAEVSYYQGAERQALSVIWVRFQRSKTHEIQLNDEHISLVYEVASEKLLGLTRMVISNESTSVSHQVALEKAIAFLMVMAPDLMGQAITVPALNKFPLSSRMEFPGGYALNECLQLNWIGQHTETIIQAGVEHMVSGIKVKYFMPKQNLWAWVIVDGEGNVQTFERNVSWNMPAMQRETQMWLHDKWLMQHIPNSNQW